jgi:hypothetical protein
VWYPGIFFFIRNSKPQENYPKILAKIRLLAILLRNLQFIEVLGIRIRMFLGLSDLHTDLLVSSTDPASRILPSSSKKTKKNLDFCCFVTSL